MPQRVQTYVSQDRNESRDVVCSGPFNVCLLSPYALGLPSEIVVPATDRPTGHSAIARGWLEVDGVKYPLSRVGPDFCQVKGSLSESDIARIDMAENGNVIVEIDGEATSNPVRYLCIDYCVEGVVHFSRLPS